MDRRVFALCAGAVALAALAAGCSSSSTAPSDPLAGSWRVTWGNLPAGTSLTPSPLTLSVSKSGGIYTASYAAIAWSFTSPVASIDTWTPDLFTLTTDSLTLLAHDVGAPNCYFGLLGAVHGTTAAGVAGTSGTGCMSGSWTWTATKQ